jgi:hypothetical protein
VSLSGTASKLWGPYLSERQWGTVREDYSADGSAWEYFPHDHARSRAYRWGEDGLAGLSDESQILCFALALWNGRDPILKERLFGLTNGEGNHGEDVKELYWYLDAVPGHAYLRMLYKYPQREYPYVRLVEENRRRGAADLEYELIDTAVLDDDRYWDVTVEYFKAAPDDILVEITAANRGPDAARLHLLPQLWFRNTWSWGEPGEKPSLAAEEGDVIVARHASLGTYRLYAEAGGELLFCENDTNVRRLWGLPAPGFFKDAFHEYVVSGNRAAVNPARRGTKASVHFVRDVDGGASTRIRLRLSAPVNPGPFADFEAVATVRRRDADAFYAGLQKDQPDEDARLVQRQALAGLLWSQQVYGYDVRRWLAGDPAGPPPPPERRSGRNGDWTHLSSTSIFSMPDKWEYPWFAAWDLGFHAIALALVDPELAKEQLTLLGHAWFQHPNGQLPAYEWAFGDANPPIHAWAAWRVFKIDRKRRRTASPHDPGDLEFLERVFLKLLLNFTWWVNRKDAEGRNLFQGGFLGLDNIGLFDRNRPLPTGGHLDQSDGTSWMAMYALDLMRISLELARHEPAYVDCATKFFEHFLYIAEAMTNIAGEGIGLWDEEDGFYYDVLRLPDGRSAPIRIRSMVGLIPLFAVETLEPKLLERVPDFADRMEWFLEHRPDLAALVSRWREPGKGELKLLSLLRGHRMKALLRRMLDPEEFLSDWGVRSLSRYHLEHPYTFRLDGDEITVRYEPAESGSRIFGGNSNWRGPVWFPANLLLIESLQKFHHYYGDDFRVECPTGSGRLRTLDEVAEELTCRLAGIFLRDADGLRPVHSLYPKLQRDPHFRDLVTFYEYFDGDSGRGVGASHQTGWTAVVAKLLQARSGYSIRGHGRSSRA